MVKRAVSAWIFSSLAFFSATFKISFYYIMLLTRAESAVFSAIVSFLVCVFWNCSIRSSLYFNSSYSLSTISPRSSSSPPKTKEIREKLEKITYILQTFLVFTSSMLLLDPRYGQYPYVLCLGRWCFTFHMYHTSQEIFLQESCLVSFLQ